MFEVYVAGILMQSQQSLPNCAIDSYHTLLVITAVQHIQNSDSALTRVALALNFRHLA